MKLLVEAFPAQPYKFKLIIADDDVRNLGTCWANELYTKMAEYAASYDVSDVYIIGPQDFAEGVVHKAKKSEVADYVRKTNIQYMKVGME